MWTDPILEELYAIRKDIAAQFNYDMRAWGEYCKTQQQLYNIPVVSLPPRYVHPPTSNSPMPELDK
jgi:hypothetical protein